MSSPKPSDQDLDSLFARMRAEPPPASVAQTALGLPARVTARLREEASAPTGATAYLRWACGLAPFSAACAAWAVFNVNELQLGALADPQAAGWLAMLFG